MNRKKSRDKRYSLCDHVIYCPKRFPVEGEGGTLSYAGARHKLGLFWPH